jgi:hypothetical protein
MDRNIQITNPVGFFERRRRLNALQKFYEEQDRLVAFFKEDEKLLGGKDVEAAREQTSLDYSTKLKWDSRLASIVFVMNLLILGGNLTASILSGSYSIISTFVDSLMDTLCSLIVQISIYAIVSQL